MFLDEVPADKVYVAGNYRCAFTDIFAVRNTEQGRRLMRDWIAILVNGVIQCHGYDQAALQMLVLQRVAGHFEHRPLNFTCDLNDKDSSVVKFTISILILHRDGINCEIQ